METNANIIPDKLTKALIDLNKTYLNCEKEAVKLIDRSVNIEVLLEELSEAFVETELKVSRLIAVSATFNAQEFAEKHMQTGKL